MNPLTRKEGAVLLNQAAADFSQSVAMPPITRVSSASEEISPVACTTCCRYPAVSMPSVSIIRTVSPSDRATSLTRFWTTARRFFNSSSFGRLAA
jgi:hypothetical protein